MSVFELGEDTYHLLNFVAGRVEEACYDEANSVAGILIYGVLAFGAFRYVRRSTKIEVGVKKLLLGLFIILTVVLGLVNRVWESSETAYNRCIDRAIEESES